MVGRDRDASPASDRAESDRYLRGVTVYVARVPSAPFVSRAFDIAPGTSAIESPAYRKLCGRRGDRLYPPSVVRGDLQRGRQLLFDLR